MKPGYRDQKLPDDPEMENRNIANDGDMPELWASIPSTVLPLDEDAFKGGNWNKQNDERKKYSETCPKFKKRFEY